MVHYPSFLVGSAVAGTAFLALHEQLSHRARLSKKWKLREMAEERVAEAWDQIRKARDPKQLQSESPTSLDLAKTWNKGVGYVQDSLRRDEN
jgi:hypothetical protein